VPNESAVENSGRAENTRSVLASNERKKEMFDSIKLRSKYIGSYSTGVRTSRTALVALIVPGLLFVLSTAVLAQNVIQAAPLNPKYLDYMAQKEAAGLTGAPLATARPGNHRTGLIPSRIDFTHLRESSASNIKPQGTSFPSSYDLRAHGMVTPVKDQGNCGSSWAFAAIASVESTLMPAIETNLSEEFIIDTNGLDWGPCQGGYQLMAIADMAAHGVIAQNLAPYQYLPPTNPTPPAISSSTSTGYGIHSVTLIAAGLNNNNEPITDNVKQQVYDGHAVAIGLDMIDQEPYLHQASNGDYCYYSGDKMPPSGTSHGVAVVGWNDDYPASKFKTKPPQNGAWLIRNSWGTWWGNQGYFWMSYYEPSVEPDAYSYRLLDPPSTYDWTYQYDPLGWTDSYGFGAGTGWMANVFRAVPQGQWIRAVSLYTYSPGTEYTVKIYDNCPTTSNSPVAGTLLVSESGTFNDAGYNTHTLKKPIRVSLGTVSSPANFSVVVKLTDPTGYSWPIPVQNTLGNETGPYSNGPSSRSTAFMGQSYMSPNGAAGTWIDLYSYSYDRSGKSTGSRACLKAFGTAK
jgi:C1A family cysteine protease